MLNNNDYTTLMIARQHINDLHREAEMNRLIAQAKSKSPKPVGRSLEYLDWIKNIVNSLLGSKKAQPTTNCA